MAAIRMNTVTALILFVGEGKQAMLRILGEVHNILPVPG